MGAFFVLFLDRFGLGEKNLGMVGGWGVCHGIDQGLGMLWGGGLGWGFKLGPGVFSCKRMDMSGRGPGGMP